MGGDKMRVEIKINEREGERNIKERINGGKVRTE